MSIGSASHGARVRIEDVRVAFGAVIAVDGVSLELEPGEVLSLLGPSGCGKTTLLKSICGLQRPDRGRILFDEVDIVPIAPHRRRVGMVFQNYALFPHLRVRENVRFGLRMHAVPAVDHAQRIDRALQLLRIENLAESYPDQLSGGQQQRVALARTLVVEPSVLLLDEPLAALDRVLRDSMRSEIRQLVKTLGITTLIVTHDQEEALSIADRVAVMNAGRIEQVGPPQTVYAAPANAFVGAFLGGINLIPTTTAAGAPAMLSVRPEFVTLVEPSAAGARRARLLERVFLGTVWLLKCELEDGTPVALLMLGVREGDLPPVGAPVGLTWSPQNAVLLAAGGDAPFPAKHPA